MNEVTLGVLNMIACNSSRRFCSAKSPRDLNLGPAYSDRQAHYATSHQYLASPTKNLASPS